MADHEGTPDFTRRATCSVEQAAEVLGISRAVAYRAAATGELPGALRIRGRWVVATRVLLGALGFGEEGPTTIRPNRIQADPPSRKAASSEQSE
jgi:hypothetical protein